MISVHEEFSNEGSIMKIGEETAELQQVKGNPESFFTIRRAFLHDFSHLSIYLGMGMSPVLVSRSPSCRSSEFFSVNAFGLGDRKGLGIWQQLLLARHGFTSRQESVCFQDLSAADRRTDRRSRRTAVVSRSVTRQRS